MPYQAIVSPQESTFVAVRPGQRAGMRLPAAMYAELANSAAQERAVPTWFVDAARHAWGIELGGRPTGEVLAVRPPSTAPVTYSRATWEINKGCNFNCEHCYLEQRRFEGLPLNEKLRMIDMLRDIGVFWFQITGGEPLIDPHFAAAYDHAHRAGMMIEILTNGSRLARTELIDLFTVKRPHKIVISLYGASPDTADALTRTRGAFINMYRGLQAARAADLPLELTLIITRHNVDEVAEMRAIADELGVPRKEYGAISPTYTGNASTLDAQAPGYLDKGAVFTGCPAGHTFFHVDPLGLVTMCKIGRDNAINIMIEGPAGLLRLPAVADAQMLRTGGCEGCALSSSCRVCRPMARVYQEAKAPLHTYCQHGERTNA